MKPLVIPASTVNTAGASVVAQALSEIIAWVLETWWQVQVPIGIRLAIAVVLAAIPAAACHFTTDSPPPPVAREAVDNAAADAEMDAAEKARKK